MFTSESGRTATVLKVTTKTITVEVERRVLNRNTGELKTEKRTREVPVDLWPTFAKAYR